VRKILLLEVRIFTRMNRMSETDLYKFVERFLREELDCFDTFQKTGPKYVGYADVLGIRDVGGRLCGDIEVTAVEVKTSRYTLAKSLGQALGYSLFAHKCYLAIPMRYSKKYSPEDKEMATHLGVGLIEIRTGQCTEILTSPHHQPINSLLLKALDYVGYGRCSICGTLIKVKEAWTKDLKYAGDTEGTMFYYIKKITDRPVTFSRQKEPTRFVYICHDCVRKLKLHKMA